MNYLTLLVTLLLFPLGGTLPPDAPAAIYLSTDRGESWCDISEGLPAGTFSQELLEVNGDLYLAVAPSALYWLPAGSSKWEPRDLGLPYQDLMVTGMMHYEGRLIISVYHIGIYVSDDRGESWRKPLFNISSKGVRCLQEFNGAIYAGTDTGLWVSTDGGENWFAEGEEKFGVQQLGVYNGKLIVAQQNGLGVLTNGEVVWSDLETASAILQITTSDDYLYVMTAGKEIWRSRDGLKWQSSLSGLMRIEAAGSIPEALWFGYKLALPTALPETFSTRLRDSSRGWVALVRGGC